MGILMWAAPKKVRTTEEHNREYSSSSEVPGTYVPNMSKDDKYAWKAKMVGTQSPPLRVEIRKTFSGSDIMGRSAYGHYAQVVIVVTEDAVQMSANGKIIMSSKEFHDLELAIKEAKKAMGVYRNYGLKPLQVS